MSFFKLATTLNIANVSGMLIFEAYDNIALRFRWRMYDVALFTQFKVWWYSSVWNFVDMAMSLHNETPIQNIIMKHSAFVIGCLLR